jgi:NADH-quinone oxidoreductase subunit N
MQSNVINVGIDYHAVLPEAITSATAIVIMLIDAISIRLERRLSGILSLAGLVGAAIAVVSLHNQDGKTSFMGMIVTDDFRLSFAMIFLVVTALIVLVSFRWIQEESLPSGEYFSLLMFATTGMLFMSAANDLVMVFLGLEITSISTYVLCGYRRKDVRSNESAVKYFILGSFSTAFLLYGIALVYGASFNPASQPVATTNLGLLKDRILSGQLYSIEMLFAGAAMMIVGFGFKIATAPFHIWSPDVYEGAPTPVTAFLSTGSKAAAFSSFARIFVLTFAAAPLTANAAESVFTSLNSLSTNALAIMAILTMTIGNLVAIVQTNIKRMLAYSSIAHAGYALVGIVALDWRSVAFYMLSYAVINIGAFAVVEVLAKRGDQNTDISDYAGIGFQSLGLASALSLFLLSLAGLPPTAGFMGKFLVFKAAWVAGSVRDSQLLHLLVVIGVLNSAISWYYYLRVIVAMFFRDPAEGFRKPVVAKPLAAALALSVAGTLYLGLLPGRVLNVLEKARDQIATRR